MICKLTNYETDHALSRVEMQPVNDRMTKTVKNDQFIIFIVLFGIKMILFVRCKFSHSIVKFLSVCPIRMLENKFYKFYGRVMYVRHACFFKFSST